MNYIKKLQRFVITFFLVLFVTTLANVDALDTLTKINGKIKFDEIPTPTEDSKLGVKHASTGAIIVGEGTSEVVSFIIPYNFVAKGKGNENTIQKHHQTWKTNMQYVVIAGNPRLHSEISLLQFLTGAEKPSRISGILQEIQRAYPGKSIKILIKNSRLKPCSTENSWFGSEGIGCSEFIENFQLQTGICIEVRTPEQIYRVLKM